MKQAGRDSVSKGERPSKRQGRREFLIKSGGVLAAGAFGAIPLRGWAAEPINIGALYPTTGSMAQIGIGCVAAAKLAVDMVNEGGGIKSLGGAKLNLIISDVQSDTTVTRTETDRLITGNKLSAIHGCYASALTLIASEVAERAKVPLITGSSSDQLNKGRTYTFTPFARASQFARAQLQMSKLVSDKPKVAVIFENTAFGTSTSNGLKELAPAEGVEIVMFEPYSAGFTDASPLINKVKSSGANALFSVSYLNDLILIVRTVKQFGLNVSINGGSGGFVIPDFYKNVGKLAEGLQGVARWNHDVSADAQKVNVEFKKRTGDFAFEYAGGLVAQTSCWPMRWNAQARPIRKRCARRSPRSTYPPATPRWRLAERSSSGLTARTFTAIRSACNGRTAISRAFSRRKMPVLLLENLKPAKSDV